MDLRDNSSVHKVFVMKVWKQEFKSQQPDKKVDITGWCMPVIPHSSGGGGARKIPRTHGPAFLSESQVPVRMSSGLASDLHSHTDTFANWWLYRVCLGMGKIENGYLMDMGIWWDKCSENHLIIISECINFTICGLYLNFKVVMSFISKYN